MVASSGTYFILWELIYDFFHPMAYGWQHLHFQRVLIIPTHVRQPRLLVVKCSFRSHWCAKYQNYEGKSVPNPLYVFPFIPLSIHLFVHLFVYPSSFIHPKPSRPINLLLSHLVIYYSPFIWRTLIPCWEHPKMTRIVFLLGVHYPFLGCLVPPTTSLVNPQDSCPHLHDVDENYRTRVVHVIAVPWVQCGQGTNHFTSF